MSARTYSLLGLWPIIHRWKRLVLAAVGFAALVSLVVALLLPNIYKSTAIFYPTNAVYPTNTETSDLDRFITEQGNKREISNRPEDLDRLITIGNSQPVAEQIILKYNLHERYDVGTPGNELDDQDALEEFTENLDIVHNERDAIELTFLDEDKKLAARIANDLMGMIDSINQQLTLENRRRVLDLYRTRYTYLNKEYTRTKGALLTARKRFGIYGMDRESRFLAQEIIETQADMYRAESAGDAGRAAALRRSLRALTQADGGSVINLENYVQGADSISTLEARFEDLQLRLVQAQAAFENAELALKGRVSSLYVVQKAIPAARKSQPVRWLIVASSVLITFVLSVIVVTLIELYRRNLGANRRTYTEDPVLTNTL
ncbi:hypothetical protein D3Y59_06880 [Hymenobacter oligotrophus]|uniref:Polysaccharide chain length determinant N-terminal domain-containing protein n=1 Tax=Hymenobacter oligotrophus TaxID=2319843 RepID=A0A3B7QYA3_9BACT|nr:hypothetical protein [Hymenobacter oligotrophus]AYA36804.1 hypothetical protein D3Y59_06880 [Hymenobacter oligotrophus]